MLNEHLRKLYGPTVAARFTVGANRPEKRDWSIQQISGYMCRLIQGRPALMVHPRCAVTIDGFEAGYVYDDKVIANAAMPNFRKAKKDGYYDHLQNTAEYTVLSFGASQPMSPDLGNMTHRQRLAAMQTDTDDPFAWGATAGRGRAGY